MPCRTSPHHDRLTGPSQTKPRPDRLARPRITAPLHSMTALPRPTPPEPPLRNPPDHNSPDLAPPCLDRPAPPCPAAPRLSSTARPRLAAPRRSITAKPHQTRPRHDRLDQFEERHRRPPLSLTHAASFWTVSAAIRSASITPGTCSMLIFATEHTPSYRLTHRSRSAAAWRYSSPLRLPSDQSTVT